jgi:hypothetical protein
VLSIKDELLLFPYEYGFFIEFKIGEESWRGELVLIRCGE